MDRKDWSRLLAGIAVTAPIPYVAFSQTYLTETQAVEIFFPQIKFKPSWVELTPAQVKEIEKASGRKVRETRVHIYWGPNREAVIIDKVIGKHEFITYAVGIKKNGQVKGVEILDYRESYGYEIRRPEWRNQFVGKDARSTLKLDEDITNISGATLSSAHVTDGVRRVLTTYEILKKKA